MNNIGAKHKVFISYYHKEDQIYKDKIVNVYDQYIINKSVGIGDISSDVSDDYIKQLIQRGYITDTSVLIVLIGPNTKNRKHVDWEISAALSKKVGGYSGLIGILLPTFPINPLGVYDKNNLPRRFADNLDSGYAKLIKWTDLQNNHMFLLKIINDAFEIKKTQSWKIKNSRVQMSRNIGMYKAIV